MAKEIKELERYPANISLFRMMSKSMFVVSARDLLLMQHIILDSNTGRLESVTASIEDPICPPDENFVRGEMKILGLRVTPAESGKSNVMIISMANPKGSIPDMIKSTIAKKQAGRINSMLNAFLKRFG